MAGEEQYIHPIIQAMISGQQQMLARNELAQRIAYQKQQQVEESKRTQIEQQRADQAEKQLEQAHEYQKGMLDIYHQRQQAELAEHKLNAYKGIREELAGGTPPEALSNTGNEGTPILPGTIGTPPGGTPDTRSFSIPELGIHINLDELRRMQQQVQQTPVTQARAIAGAKAGGEAEAEEPFKEKFLGLQFANAKQLKQMEIDYQMKKDKFDKATALQLEHIRVGPEYQRNQLEYGMTPEQSEAAVNGFMVGDFMPATTDLTNPKAARAYTNFKQLGGKALNKDDNQFFENANRIEGVLKDLAAVSSQLPDERKLGSQAAVLNARAQAAITNTSFSTDLRNKLNELNLQIPAVMRAAQQYPGSRMNTNDMLLAQKGMGNIGTMQQGEDFGHHLRRMVDDNIVSAEAGMPKIQQDLLWNNKHITPAYIIQSKDPDMESSGHTLDMNQSIKMGKAIYDSPTGVQ